VDDGGDDNASLSHVIAVWVVVLIYMLVGGAALIHFEKASERCDAATFHRAASGTFARSDVQVSPISLVTYFVRILGNHLLAVRID
jgi:hypothetical protein